jgi:hypothetical protein
LKINIKVNNFVLEPFLEDFKLVTYYSVRWDTHELSETDKFIQKFLKQEILYKKDLQEILTLIEEIGNERGAKDIYFSRFEESATALPPSKSLIINGLEILFYENKLRLYCIKISENIVVLFNGGVKSSQKVSDSPDIALKFREAQIFAKKIWRAIVEKDILVDDVRKRLTSPYNQEEIIL